MNRKWRLLKVILKLRNVVIVYISTFFFLVTISSCMTKERVIYFPPTNLSAEPLIPMPLKIVATNSGFALDKYTAIHVDENEDVF